MNKPPHNPPGWIKRFFAWYCGDDVAEDLLGDMDELFHQNLRMMSLFRARWKYILQIFVLLFSYGIKYRKRKHNDVHGSPTVHSFAMFGSYAKIAFRNLAKQKVFAVINMVCLAVGMSVGLLALAVWIDIIEVDDYHINADNIYRITTKIEDGNENLTYASSSAPLAEKMKEDISGVREVVQIENNFNAEVVQSGNTEIPFTGYFATRNFLTVFTFPLEKGNRESALDKPFSVVLTRETAEKLFRDVNPVGKILEVKGLGNFEVTGVLKDYGRSHFLFDALASFSTLALLEQQKKIKPTLQDWGPRTSYYSYILLNKGTSGAELAANLERISPPHVEGEPSVKLKYGLQPFIGIPLDDLNNEIGLSWGDVALYVFFALALLVLLPACFNYSNIAIARALKRAKEIGLRKVSGGESRHIFFQMVIETIILSLLSLSGALLIFIAVRDGFLSMVVMGTRTFDLEITPLTIVVFVLFGIFTGILAGAFPALYFAKLNPIETLRNSSQSGKLSKISIRKGLIVVQFVMSLFFVLSITIIFKQYRYVLNYDMGFQKENILDIPLQGVDPNVLKTELKKLPEVSTLSMSSGLPGNWSVSGTSAKTAADGDSLDVFQLFVDQAYLDNLGLTLIAGSAFPEDLSSRESYTIVNETLLRKFNLGTPHEALNKTLLVDKKELRIYGVVKDFNYMPLREEINSFFFRYDPAQFRYANVKLRSNDIQATLDKMAHIWKTVSEKKFEAKFLDDELDDSLTSFKSMIKIFGFLGMLAITISCLGLLAVVISTAESRIKEMGIRKIMGATVPNLVFTLSKGFLILIGIAILIGTPLTYFAFDKIFLRLNFYRANIGFTELALGIILLVSIVLVIIGSQTMKVARINPVDTLKYE